ncbi:hypothetical protein LS73_005800 [Helicobacter muridarum]|uniref:Deoxycytidine triphosphate deaminase n=1 Tax=Helicobacter muridarum TaxID=216 RepID=A0A099U1Y7_9HELI|nr:hypothetical protein [Helicobacter muridarum]TLE00043.1 hypothetical protein LS73_005800 [Helicobacter muridarum]STQ86110.1 deoxycytidine triphosphate deaminase [Helicobacter muridarum]
MVLGFSELKDIAPKHITCLNDNNIRGSSIDLSLSEEAKIIKHARDINLFEDNIDKTTIDNMYETINLARGYPLKPQTFLYTSTCEHVTIPIDKCGLILPRSTFARLGLILPMSLYANPGYKGHLPIIIFNASPCTITIPPYIRIAQLLLLEVKGDAQPYNSFEDSKYHDESKLTSPSFNDSEIGEILEKL